MGMSGFELWDTRSHNLMADFETEAQGLAAVCQAIRAFGVEYVDSIVLLRVGPRGGLARIATGAALARVPWLPTQSPRL